MASDPLPPPPADVIVVNPEPEIEESLPLTPFTPFPLPEPPSPTVIVSAFPEVTSCVEVL